MRLAERSSVTTPSVVTLRPDCLKLPAILIALFALFLLPIFFLLCSLALLPLGLWRSLAFLSLALRFRLGALPLLILLPLLLLLALLILLLLLLLALLILLPLLILLALLVLPLHLLLLTLLILLPLLHTLLIILLRYRLARLVTVLLGSDRMLLFDLA
ncbi:MAG TPA: hypothetical protein VFW53_02355, partial [Gallionella sp.]|nr:hypothetical protein [Gallionella sp.]